MSLSESRQDEANPEFWWDTQGGKISLPCLLAITHFVLQKQPGQ